MSKRCQGIWRFYLLHSIQLVPWGQEEQSRVTLDHLCESQHKEDTSHLLSESYTLVLYFGCSQGDLRWLPFSGFSCGCNHFLRKICFSGKNGQKLKNSNLPNLCRECSGRLRQQVFYLLSFLHIDQLKQEMSIRGYITFIFWTKHIFLELFIN